jgi:hypothetical protein
MGDRQQQEIKKIRIGESDLPRIAERKRRVYQFRTAAILAVGTGDAVRRTTRAAGVAKRKRDRADFNRFSTQITVIPLIP